MMMKERDGGSMESSHSSSQFQQQQQQQLDTSAAAAAAAAATPASATKTTPTSSSSFKKRVHFEEQQQQQQQHQQKASSPSTALENGTCNQQQQQQQQQDQDKQQLQTGILRRRSSSSSGSKSVENMRMSRSPLMQIHEKSSSVLLLGSAVTPSRVKNKAPCSSSRRAAAAFSSSSSEEEEDHSPTISTTTDAAAAAAAAAARFSLIGSNTHLLDSDDVGTGNSNGHEPSSLMFLSPIPCNTAEKLKRLRPPLSLSSSQSRGHAASSSSDFFTPKSKQDNVNNNNDSEEEDPPLLFSLDTHSPPLLGLGATANHSGSSSSIDNAHRSPLVLSPAATNVNQHVVVGRQEASNKSASSVEHHSTDNDKECTISTTTTKLPVLPDDKDTLPGIYDASRKGHGESTQEEEQHQPEQVENRDSSKGDNDDSGNISNRDEEEETQNNNNNRSHHHNHNNNLSFTEQQQEDYIQQARQDVGVTSQAFIERLRGAAFRRKLNLTKCRDSLVAKERQQRLAIAAALESKRLRQQESKNNSNNNKNNNNSSMMMMMDSSGNSSSSFKARPVPAKTNINKSGAAGLPWNGKKKEPTIPLSPGLGTARRPAKESLKGCNQQQQHAAFSCRSTSSFVAAAFKARSLPKTNDLHGGLAGVPKVPKRPVTIPYSPLLGARRRQAQKEEQQHQHDPAVPATCPRQSASTSSSCTRNDTEQQQQQNRRTPLPPLPAQDTSRRQSMTNSCSSKASSNLLGVDFLSPDSVHISRHHDDTTAVAGPPPITPRRTIGSFPPSQQQQRAAYIPHSTIRAKKRAEFDARRKVNEEQRWQQERLERQQKVNAMHKELKEWAKKL